jgi:hypothetical protein
LVRGDDPARQLQTAEGWLKDHPQDASLLLTLGRLSLQNRLWGKARDYLESSLRMERNPEPVPSWRGCWPGWARPSAATSCSRRALGCWTSACWRCRCLKAFRLTACQARARCGLGGSHLHDCDFFVSRHYSYLPSIDSLRISDLSRCSALKQSVSFLYRFKSLFRGHPAHVAAHLRTLFLPAFLAAFAVLVASFRLESTWPGALRPVLQPAPDARVVRADQPGGCHSFAGVRGLRGYG